MQNYKEINGNDYVKDSRTTINETMRSIQSMNSGTVFPTTNLFEGMKCYRTDLKKTYTLTDVENNTWVEDDTASKLSTARKINIVGDATGAAIFDGSGDISINTTVSQATHADKADTATAADRATQVVATAPTGGGLDVIHAIMASNDAMRIRIYGDTNNGALEIATSDDGTEPIYVRQYNNSHIDTFATAARTAAILDGNGNTSFPGTVTAARFTGPLNGNAATATRATTATKADSLTDNLVFPDIGNVATSNKISWSGSTDGADIYYQTTASDQGNLVLNLRDNDNCYLRIAYNGAFKSYFTPADGNFHGNVNGNADTATSAGSARLISPFEIGTTNVFRNVWFSDSDTSNKACYSPNIQYNPSTNVLKVGTVQGTATNADTVDGYHASDIINRITAANTGGIVAASLTENGYVKFANGLILQWGNASGNASNNSNNTNFPIAFSSACFAMCISQAVDASGNNYIGASRVKSTSKVGFVWGTNSGRCFWIAIGM